jgi:cytochrome c peroxidase
MVLSLRNIRHTGPWFWHGWQNDLHAAVAKSLGDTMQGPPPTDDDVAAVLAYLDTLDGQSAATAKRDLPSDAQRGRAVFASAQANCASCHSGPYFTDGQIHDVGLNSEYDVYEGFNTPSLLGCGNRVRYLHHGRALSLDDLLSDLHSPAKVSGTQELTEQQRADLIAYLRTL